MKLTRLQNTLAEITNWEFDVIPTPEQPAILADRIDGYCFFGDAREETFDTFKLFTIRDIENFNPNYQLIEDYCQDIFDSKLARFSLENEDKQNLLTTSTSNDFEIELF
jgi:hypothetical protein